MFFKNHFGRKTKLKLTLIHKFHICKFTCSLKFNCNPITILLALLKSATDACKAVKNLSAPCTHSQPRSDKVTFRLASAHAVNKHPFHSWFNATYFAFLGFLLMISLLRMALKRSTEMLSGVPNKCKKAAMFLLGRDSF